jgi:carboxymethylenebutenolidase
MRRISAAATAATAAFTLAAVLSAPAAFAEVKVSEVTLKAGDDEFKAFVAEPEGPGPFPAVIVIQEWWGLNDWIKGNAKHLAEKGYVAIAPDLYHGKLTDDPKVASQLRMGLPKDRALRDLKAAVDHAAGKANVNKEKIGSIGWCMGGQYSLQLALHEPRVSATVMCYGAVVTKAEDLKPLKATVLGVFGGEDKGIPVADVKAFGDAMTAAGKTLDGLIIYPETGHAFMRPKMPAGPDNPAYKADNAKDAWAKIEAFFAKTLGGK